MVWEEREDCVPSKEDSLILKLSREDCIFFQGGFLPPGYNGNLSGVSDRSWEQSFSREGKGREPWTLCFGEV